MQTDISSRPKVSVVVPTFNRRASVMRLLSSLCEQSYPASGFEVLVADDGGSDDTAAAIAAASFPYRLQYLRQEHLGVGAARNLGLANATGDLILYLDDDMVAESQLVSVHAWAHKERPRAVVKGRVVLALDNPETEFARRQNGKADLSIPPDNPLRPITYQQVFAGQFSIVRGDALRVGGWCEEPREYGFQDLEFMYRCARDGLQMLYAPTAVTHHHDHVSTLAGACRRFEKASYSAATHLFVQHPELRTQIPMFRDKLPVKWRMDGVCLIARKTFRGLVSTRPAEKLLLFIVGVMERVFPRLRLLDKLYSTITQAHMYRGYRAGLRRLGDLQVLG